MLEMLPVEQYPPNSNNNSGIGGGCSSSGSVNSDDHGVFESKQLISTQCQQLPKQSRLHYSKDVVECMITTEYDTSSSSLHSSCTFSPYNYSIPPFYSNQDDVGSGSSGCVRDVGDVVTRQWPVVFNNSAIKSHKKRQRRSASATSRRNQPYRPVTNQLVVMKSDSGNVVGVSHYNPDHSSRPYGASDHNMMAADVHAGALPYPHQVPTSIVVQANQEKTGIPNGSVVSIPYECAKQGPGRPTNHVRSFWTVLCSRILIFLTILIAIGLSFILGFMFAQYMHKTYHSYCDHSSPSPAFQVPNIARNSGQSTFKSMSNRVHNRTGRLENQSNTDQSTLSTLAPVFHLTVDNANSSVVANSSAKTLDDPFRKPIDDNNQTVSPNSEDSSTFSPVSLTGFDDKVNKTVSYAEPPSIQNATIVPVFSLDDQNYYNISTTISSLDTDYLATEIKETWFPSQTPQTEIVDPDRSTSAPNVTNTISLRSIPEIKEFENYSITVTESPVPELFTLNNTLELNLFKGPSTETTVSYEESVPTTVAPLTRPFRVMTSQLVNEVFDTLDHINNAHLATGGDHLLGTTQAPTHSNTHSTSITSEIIPSNSISYEPALISTETMDIPMQHSFKENSTTKQTPFEELPPLDFNSVANSSFTNFSLATDVDTEKENISSLSLKSLDVPIISVTNNETNHLKDAQLLLPGLMSNATELIELNQNSTHLINSSTAAAKSTSDTSPPTTTTTESLLESDEFKNKSLVSETLNGTTVDTTNHLNLTEVTLENVANTTIEANQTNPIGGGNLTAVPIINRDGKAFDTYELDLGGSDKEGNKNQTAEIKTDHNVTTVPSLVQTAFCLESQFQCPNKSQLCLNNDRLCDGIVDCPDDQFDEMDCGEKQCGENFQCRPLKLSSMWTNVTTMSPLVLGSNNTVSPLSNTTIHSTSTTTMAPVDIQCIPRRNYCDGVWDCSDGSDEIGCSVTKCKPNEFKCADSSGCLTGKQACDGVYNCRDHSDEIGCISRSSCESSNRFYCDNGLCIEKSLVCDGRSDCLNSTDEMNCATPDTCSHLEGKYLCRSGECIDASRRCDGHVNCLDYSDEDLCFENDVDGVVYVYNAQSHMWSLYCAPLGFSQSDADNLCAKLGHNHATNYTLMPVSRLLANSTWAVVDHSENSTLINVVSSSANTTEPNRTIYHTFDCPSNFSVTIECASSARDPSSDPNHPGGLETPDEVPSPLYVTYTNGSEKNRRCPAYVLASKWLITSGQCLMKMKYQNVKELLIQNGNKSEAFNITQIRIHPKYSIFRTIHFPDNDMALVETEQILPKSTISPSIITLPESRLDPKITCFLGTYGDTAFEVMETSVCNSSEHFAGSLTNRLICAWRTPPTNGNKNCLPPHLPMICLTSQSHWYLSGFISHQRGCDLNDGKPMFIGYQPHPTVFSNLFEMKHFIHQTLGIGTYHVQRSKAVVPDGLNGTDIAMPYVADSRAFYVLLEDDKRLQKSIDLNNEITEQDNQTTTITTPSPPTSNITAENANITTPKLNQVIFSKKVTNFLYSSPNSMHKPENTIANTTILSEIIELNNGNSSVEVNNLTSSIEKEEVVVPVANLTQNYDISNVTTLSPVSNDINENDTVTKSTITTASPNMEMTEIITDMETINPTTVVAEEEFTEAYVMNLTEPTSTLMSILNFLTTTSKPIDLINKTEILNEGEEMMVTTPT